MTSIIKIKRSKYHARCTCGLEIQRGDLVGISSNSYKCWKCSKRALRLRLKILEDWRRDKQEMLNVLSLWLKNPKVQTELMLRIIEG
jgi:hypothetical protein